VEHDFAIFAELHNQAQQLSSEVIP